MMQQNNQQERQSLEQEKSEVTPEVSIGVRLVETLSDLLKSGDWDSSLFLKTVKRRISDIINETRSAMANTHRSAVVVAGDLLKQAAPSGYVRVYVLLYQTDGSKLVNWQYALKTLLGYNVSRPTYRDERHIQELVRSKKDIERYGYAVVNIVERDVYSREQFPLKDQFDHEMVVLKENSIGKENIVGFIHANKRRYAFVDGELMYQGDVVD